MAITADLLEARYKETFEQETMGLVRRRQADPNYKIEDLEGALKHLYIREGANLDGRGSLQDTILSATIAAYEQYIVNWRSQV